MTDRNKKTRQSKQSPATGGSMPDMEPPEFAMPSDEERAALFMLCYEEAADALEREDPVAVAIATEYILQYSEQVGELLKNGRDYLELLSPKENTPAIERLAMEVVLEAVEEELAGEEA